MTDLSDSLDDTLAAIDIATGCQQCEGPLGHSPSQTFCSETCQAAWNAGIEGRLATTIVEWQHPHKGRIAEPLCDIHEAAVRAALRMLGVGHSGRLSGTSACYRCIDGQEPRNWIDRFVVERTDSRGTR